jgi:hypothetical protein
LILIPKLHRDPIVPESEQLLAQTIVVLALPFGRQKLDNGVCAREEEGTVTPDACRSVGLRDFRWIPFVWLVGVVLRRSATSSPCDLFKGLKKWISPKKSDHDQASTGTGMLACVQRLARTNIGDQKHARDSTHDALPSATWSSSASRAERGK